MYSIIWNWIITAYVLNGSLNEDAPQKVKNLTSKIANSTISTQLTFNSSKFELKHFKLFIIPTLDVYFSVLNPSNNIRLAVYVYKVSKIFYESILSYFIKREQSGKSEHEEI